MLLVHGRQDTVVPVTDAHRISKRGCERNVTLIEGDGTHEAFDDADGITRDILEFVESALCARSAKALSALPQPGVKQHMMQQLCAESAI